MKNMIRLQFMLLLTVKCLAQSPVALQQSVTPKTIGAAPNNPWLVSGIQAGYSVSGGDFSSAFQASGRALLEVLGRSSTKGGIFVMGNLTKLGVQKSAELDSKIKELQQASQGLNVGFYPHYIIAGDPTKKNASLTLYAPLLYKVNAFESADKTDVTYLNQFRASVGAEVAFLYGQSSGLPITISVEPAITFFNKNDYQKVFEKTRSSLPSIEASIIFPIGLSAGLMGIYSTSAEKTAQFTVGIVLLGKQ
jgi:hypothetical protein